MNELFIAKLKKLAEEESWTDVEDFCVEDFAGGNLDDAFYGGEHCGRRNLAREVLDALSIEWKNTHV